MLGQIAGEVWLSCGYAVLLLLVAYAVDAGARALVSRAATLHHEDATTDQAADRHHEADSWPATEAERFHRGIACVVVIIGILWPASMLFTGRSGPEILLLVATLVLVAAASWPLWRHLRRTPAGFPEAEGVGTAPSGQRPTPDHALEHPNG